MGFFDKVKRAATGPVTIDLAVAESFRWTDEALRITARLTNETDEAIAIAEVRFALTARTSGNKQGSTWSLKQTVAGPIMLDPGATTELTAELPLGVGVRRSTMEAAATEAGLPAWTGGAMKSVVGEIPKRSGAHQVSVTVKVDGSARLSSRRADTSAI